MTPQPKDAPLDPELAASCRAAVAAADRERNPLAPLAAAFLLGFLLLGGATLAWLRLRVMPAVAAPVTLVSALAAPAKGKPAPAPAPPAPPPLPIRNTGR